MHFKQRYSYKSLAISVAIHVAVVIALLSIVFRYPLGQLMGIPKSPYNPERLTFVRMPPPPAAPSARTTAPDAGAAPAPLTAPVEVPATIPPPADSARSQASGSNGNGLGDTGDGVATGLVPRVPDPRIALVPGPLHRMPRSTAQDIDSIMSLVVGIYTDSLAIAARQRRPGDWTLKGKGGTWGWDDSGIRLGKFTIPNALLALLPLNVASGQSPIEVRNAQSMRTEVMENAQRVITQEEFRAAVKRIRERKERERRNNQVAEDGRRP